MVSMSIIGNNIHEGIVNLGSFCYKHKKEILITGLFLMAIGSGVAAAAVLSGENFFIIKVAMADTIYGTSVPGWWGITGMTQTGSQCLYGICAAVMGLAITSFAGGMYAR